ncbi:MAG: hypothetical protein B7Z37_06085 [Verrucomicrobia bacterium 12-59-8]|nr:MAG: hypothetical protein B7Z37_06085 [Verrucomicrobia bacterium 12-59-8]
MFIYYLIVGGILKLATVLQGILDSRCMSAFTMTFFTQPEVIRTSNEWSRFWKTCGGKPQHAL